MVRALHWKELDKRKFLGEFAAHPHRNNLIVRAVENRDFRFWITFVNLSNASAVIVVLDQEM